MPFYYKSDCAQLSVLGASPAECHGAISDSRRCAVSDALSPLDLIPDFIPVLGLVDDLIVLPGLIWLAIRAVPSEVGLCECLNTRCCPSSPYSCGSIAAAEHMPSAWALVLARAPQGWLLAIMPNVLAGHGGGKGTG